MITPDYVRLMAAYNDWQNRAIYGAADTLDDEARRMDRSAFFGSIHATLNHLLWGDQTWMSRLAGTAPPGASGIPESTTMHSDWAALENDRRLTDQIMLDWSKRVTAAELAGEFAWYSHSYRREVRRPKWALVVQLFNHGTHHRGQVHAMLTAAGARTEDTDVQYLDSTHFPWPAAMRAAE